MAAQTWYHLAVTYDATTVRVYLNGQPQGSFAAGAPVTPSGPLRVCGRYFPSPWAGTLDELRLDNRAWSAGEVLTEYQRATTATGRVGHKILGQ
jgi:hypothetical protein